VQDIREQQDKTLRVLFELAVTSLDIIFGFSQNTGRVKNP
jgi:hypothetical protein